MRNLTGKICLMLAFSLAGTSVITGHLLSEKLSSFTITTLSLGILLLCLLPFYYKKSIETIRQLKRSDWKMLVMQAVFGIFLFRIFLLFGINRTSTVEAGILTGTTPAITSILAYLILKEKPGSVTLFGIGCTVAGIVFLQGANFNAIQFSTQHLWGNLFILCAASSESIFNILSRKHRTTRQTDSQMQIHPVEQTLLVAAIAFVLSLIPAFLEKPLAAIQAIGWQEWLALVWYGLVITALGFVFFYAGVKRCDAYTTAAFSGMMPLTSMLLSLFFLRETISYTQWAGGCLIILSMLLIGRELRLGKTKRISAELPSSSRIP